jgi:hypothetical protein
MELRSPCGRSIRLSAMTKNVGCVALKVMNKKSRKKKKN